MRSSRLSPTAWERIRAIRAGARCVLLSDGWIGIEPPGGPLAQVSPARWAAMRAEAPDLPAPETMPREAAGAFCERALRPPIIMRRPGSAPGERARARRA